MGESTLANTLRPVRNLPSRQPRPANATIAVGHQTEIDLVPTMKPIAVPSTLRNVPRGKGAKTMVTATVIITPNPPATMATAMTSAAIIPVLPMARAVTIATVPKAGIRDRPAAVPAVRLTDALLALLRAVLWALRVSATTDLFLAVPLVRLAVAPVDHPKDALAADPDLALATDGMVR